MGVLTPGSAHLDPPLSLPSTTAEILPHRCLVCGRGILKKMSDKFLIFKIVFQFIFLADIHSVFSIQRKYKIGKMQNVISSLH
jgi:hypothetical protein